MRYVVLYVCIFLLAFAACRKEKIFPNTRLEGTVTDSTNGESLDDVQIELYRWKDTGLWNSYYKKIDLKSTETDPGGHWEIKFRQVNGRRYVIDFNKDGYYLYQAYQSESEILAPEICLVPKGYIEVRLSDDPSNSYTKVHVKLYNNYSTNCYITTCSGYLPDNRILEAVGNANNIIEWTLYSNTDCWGDDIPGPTYTDTIWVEHNAASVFELVI